MITGFNTDVEHDGTVYHVQTEDKGLESPLILSLVYVGGAILASKRSPYDDLISKGFDERELADRLQRQHKLICAAIRAGRIDDLKRMNQRDANAPSAAAVASAKPPASQPPVKERAPAEVAQAKTFKEPVVQEQSAQPSPEVKVKKTPPPKGARHTMRSILQDVVADFARAEAASGATLHLSLIDEREFRGGGTVTLQIKVAQDLDGKEAIAGADVTVKVLGSTFRPLIFPTKTGADGIATVRAVLPHFQTGRAALLVRAIANGYEAELRRIIHQG